MARDFYAPCRATEIHDGSECLGFGPDGLDCVGIHKVDGRAAESAAGQPGTETSWDIPGHGGESVELGGDDLEVVAHAAVRFIHQLTQSGNIVCEERLSRGKRSLVLRDDVASSLT